MRSIKLLLAAIVAILNVQLTFAEKAYVFTYFDNSKQSAGMCMAYSYDGFHWTALNNNKPIITPEIGKESVLRDPSICQGPDGTFHMVWTTAWRDNYCIGYASSKDLIHWSQQREISVMHDFPTTRNVWAPELFYDKKSGLFYIYWASTVPGAKNVSTDGCVSENEYNHRIYYTTTRDFKTFAKTNLFFNPKFNAIDASIVQDPANGEYIMFVKNENLNPAEKNIRVTRTKSLKKGFPTEVSAPVSGEEWAEGPAPLFVGDDLIVYFDHYRKHQFGAAISHDKGKTWEDASDKIKLSAGISHGTAIAVDKSYVDALVEQSVFGKALTFVEELMSKMTLEEKIGQLNLQVAGNITTGAAMNTEVGKLVADGNIGSILNLSGKDKIRAIQKVAVEESRLGIPLLVGLDVIHGYRTIFPVPLAQSCSWDLKAIEAGARIAAEECSSDGISWTYSPMVDICRDARWGRIMEGNGEDPFLGGLIAKAMVRGYQGDLTGKHDVLACLKHFGLYGAAEGGRDYNTVDMSHLQMFNGYFPPYKAAVEAGVASVMSSFNIVDGQHATANKWLQDEVLRKMWGFNGFVVTDYNSIEEMTTWGFGDKKENGAKAMRAGTDMDMCSQSFLKHCKEMLAEGLITEQDIDKACRRVLAAKYKIGLFDDPYKHCSMTAEEQSTHTFTPEHRKAAREMAAETFVLLKNEGNLLPLKKEGKIALIGPNAAIARGMLGSWCVTQPPLGSYPSLKDCMQEALEGKAELLYAQGSNFSDIPRQKAAGNTTSDGKGFITEVDNAEAHDEALAVAAQADIIVCAMGEGSEWTGESRSRSSLDMPAVQMRLLQDLAKLGKPIVLLNYSGRPTVMEWERENIPAIMNVWFGGSEMGSAICDVLFGEKAPCGRLTTSIPKSVGQQPMYYNHMNTGRPAANDLPMFRGYQSNYFEVSNGPAFPFGYGLTYTTFEYGKMSIEGKGTNLSVKVSVKNTGNCDAYEVVQLYIHDVAATYARPVKELKGFERIFLKAGETKTVSIPLDREKLSYYDHEGNLLFEPGEFEIMIGSSSADKDLQRQKVNIQ